MQMLLSSLHSALGPHKSVVNMSLQSESPRQLQKIALQANIGVAPVDSNAVAP